VGRSGLEGSWGSSSAVTAAGVPGLVASFKGVGWRTVLARLRFNDFAGLFEGVSLGVSEASGAVASSRARALVDRRGSDMIMGEDDVRVGKSEEGPGAGPRHGLDGASFRDGGLMPQSAVAPTAVLALCTQHHGPVHVLSRSGSTIVQRALVPCFPISISWACNYSFVTLNITKTQRTDVSILQ